MKNIWLLFFAFISLPIFAQDYIFTNFVQTPLFIGPQFASGTEERVVSHTRIQSLFLENAPVYYSNFIALNKIILEDSSNTFAVAPKLSFDKAGESVFSQNGFGTSIAFSRKLKQSNGFKNVSSAGLDVMLFQSSVNEMDLRWPTQIGPGGFDPTLPGEDVSKINYIIINAGLNTHCEWEKLSFDLGYTIFNVNRPSYILINGSQNMNRKDMRHQYYMAAQYELSKLFTIKPRFLYTYQGTQSAYIAGSDISYSLRQNAAITVGSGVLKNGYYFTGGFSANKFRMALSFDVFNTIDFYGGELSMGYKI